MKISNIQGYNYQPKPVNTNFGAWRKEVYISSTNGRTLENLKHTTATWMFREGPDWKNLIGFLAQKYKDVPKINVYDYACSNGSEAYTFLVAMFNDMGYDFTKKFTPIIAKDYDAGAIYNAQSGKINLEPDEISAIDIYTNDRFLNYFFTKYDDSRYCIRNWNVGYLLRENVDFSVGDVFEDYKHIKPDNSVVFIRNVWPYFKVDNRKMLAQNIYDALGQNSILITGMFDEEDPYCNIPISQILKDTGFKPVPDLDYVYQKV